MMMEVWIREKFLNNFFMENIIVNITIGLMVLKILYNIISGYLSVKTSKKKYLKDLFTINNDENHNNESSK